MRKPVHSTESSIEEILASIRSIIAEDGAAPRSSGQVQAHRPARHLTENPESAPYEEDADKTSERAAASADSEQQLAKATGNGDEILELTEDIMLAEMSQDAPVSDQEDVAADLPRDDNISQDISDEFRHAPLPEEEELDEVLSNLAAEVERLGVSEAERNESLQNDLAEDQPAEKQTNTGQGQLPEEETMGGDAPDFAKEDVQAVGQPQIAGIEEPKPTMPAAAPPPPPYARQPAPSVAKSKPMWSARRLEMPGKPAAPAPEKETAASQTNQEQSTQPAPSAPAPAAQSSQPSPVSRRDLWAEGVQMPVPDTGPEIPLPLSEDNSELDVQQTSAQEEDTTSAEKLTVGGFLTRVFGSAPAEETKDEPAADENDLRARAEKLARDTISDFAEAKLNAPAMGNALKADKEFMDEVTSTLANALASTDEEADTESAVKAELPQSLSGQEAEPETAIKSGLDERLKEALATDAPASEETAVEQKLEDESESSAEIAIPMLAQSTQDEAVQFARDDHESVSSVAAEYEEPVSAEHEAAASETAEIEQAAAVEEATAVEEVAAELPPEMPDDLREGPAETAASQEEQADNATGPSTPALNLPSSLEGSIKDMIKPLIIQWLNDNMPRIVEEAVREELTDRSDMPKVTNKSRA